MKKIKRKQMLRHYSLLAVFCLLIAGCESKVILHSELSEKDANQVVSALISHGIDAEKDREKAGLVVLINRGNMADAVKLLISLGLPKRHQTSLGEIFKKEGVISTPLEERARYIYALSQELEYTLSEMDGVVVARVHVVLPERIAPGEPVQPSSAAVFIKHEEIFDPDIYTSRVKSLVASSIPGLWDKDKTDKIAIVYSAATKSQLVSSWEFVGPFKVDKISTELLWNSIYFLTLLFAVMVITIFLIANSGIRKRFLMLVSGNKSAGTVQQ